MMDVFPKFIIETDNEEGDCLIIAKCTFHKELATDTTKVKGGGWWKLKDNVFTLHGESVDFGRAKIEDITDCIKRGKVYSSKALIRNLIEMGYAFRYQDESGEYYDLM